MGIELGEDGVGILTLNRPEAFNAMSPEMIAELAVVFSWFADRAPLRALIVTGAGKAFSAGGDVNWFQQRGRVRGGRPAGQRPPRRRRPAPGDHRPAPDPLPGDRRRQRAAAGAGFSLALACDIRIAADSAFFAPAYGRIGASPDGGMTYFLPRVVGPSRALELLLEDPNMRPEDALAERPRLRSRARRTSCRAAKAREGKR